MEKLRESFEWSSKGLKQNCIKDQRAMQPESQIPFSPIQNTVFKSIEQQGKRGASSTSRQNSSVTEKAMFEGPAPLMTVQMTAITGAAPAEVVSPAKVVPLQRHHFSWRQCLGHPYCQGTYSIKQTLL